MRIEVGSSSVGCDSAIPPHLTSTPSPTRPPSSPPNHPRPYPTPLHPTPIPKQTPIHIFIPTPILAISPPRFRTGGAAAHAVGLRLGLKSQGSDASVPLNFRLVPEVSCRGYLLRSAPEVISWGQRSCGQFLRVAPDVHS